MFLSNQGEITMAQAQGTGRSWVETAVVGLFGDLRTLVRQEMVLAQHEVQYEIGKILKAVVWFGMAAGLALTGSVVVAASTVLMLVEYTGLPAWACAGIVSVMVLGGAWGLMAAGLRVTKSVRLVPFRAVRTVVDDLKGMADRVRMRWTSI